VETINRENFSDFIGWPMGARTQVMIELKVLV
jgi:hypothetical protein